MAKTYSALKSQLEALQKQIEITRKKEAVAVIQRMRVAIEAYGITADDLYGTPKKPKPTAPKKKVEKRVTGRAGKTGPRPVKYADDKGNRWSGGGSTPRWMRAYLEQGRKLEDFLVKAA